jgi:hypothetical protein
MSKGRGRSLKNVQCPMSKGMDECPTYKVERKMSFFLSLASAVGHSLVSL